MNDVELDAPEDSIAWKLAAHYLKPVAHHFDNPGVTSIAVNRWDTVFIRENGSWTRTRDRFLSEDHLVSCISQIVNNLNQVIDPKTNPIADARLKDGSRLNAVLYPTAHTGSNMTIRIFPKVRYSMEDLLERGAMNEDMLKLFRLAVAVEYNILVSGATGSGKTTILNAMGNLIPDDRRVGVIEDTAELKINKSNIVSMEAPKRILNRETGQMSISMQELLVNTLRQELRNIIIGEVREASAATAVMLALNTGHRGVLSTLHANSPVDALSRLINMLLSNDTRIPYDAVVREIYGNFDMVIQCENTPRHKQRIVAVSEVTDGKLYPLWGWDYVAGKHKCLYAPSHRNARVVEFAARYGLEVDL